MATPLTADSDDRVLIVEDDAAQRVGLQQLLKSWGYAVDAASNGREALDRIQTARPTIVLSDLIMPGMSGLELLRALKHQEDGDITVVLMTAQGTVETAVDAIKQGAYDYVPKPIDPQRLKILLDQIGERHDTLREMRVLRRQLQRARHVREDDRREPGDAADLPGARAGGADRRVGAGQRRVGHGQGARRADDPPAQPARVAAVRAAQLRGDSRHAARVGAVRPREGRVHRRHRPPAGLVRAGQPRHAVPRRDRRDDAGDAGQAAARAPGAIVPAARRPARAVRGHARHRRDERRSARSGAAEPAARGPLLPAERVRDPAAAAARAEGRHPAAGAGLPHGVQHAQQQGRQRRVGQGDGGSSSATTGRATCASCATSSSARRSSRAAR